MKKISKDFFCRLFVLAKMNKMNLKAFSYALLKYGDFAIADREGENEITSLISLFEEITGIYPQAEDSFGIYDDAYWSGSAYLKLMEKSKKPLGYLLLKLPLNRLIEMYEIYHEMDYSSLFLRFTEIEKESTLLSCLLDMKGISLASLSRATGIALPTLKTFKKSDERLYAASFQKIYRLASFLDVPISLFAN